MGSQCCRKFFPLNVLSSAYWAWCEIVLKEGCDIDENDLPYETLQTPKNTQTSEASYLAAVLACANLMASVVSFRIMFLSWMKLAAAGSLPKLCLIGNPRV